MASADLVNFLNSNRANCALFTHNSMMEPKGKFYLGSSKTDEFMNLYCKNVRQM